MTGGLRSAGMFLLILAILLIVGMLMQSRPG
jgi:hypothetical protein